MLLYVLTDFSIADRLVHGVHSGHTPKIHS